MPPKKNLKSSFPFWFPPISRAQRVPFGYFQTDTAGVYTRSRVDSPPPTRRKYRRDRLSSLLVRPTYSLSPACAHYFPPTVFSTNPREPHATSTLLPPLGTAESARTGRRSWMTTETGTSRARTTETRVWVRWSLREHGRTGGWQPRR